jgi:hypothetical protein
MEAFLSSRETGTSERSQKLQASILYLGQERTDEDDEDGLPLQ